MTNRKRRILLTIISLVCVLGCTVSVYVKKKIEIQKATTRIDRTEEMRFDLIYEVYEGKNGSAAIITKNDKKYKALWWLLEGRYVVDEKTDYTNVKIDGLMDHTELHLCELCIYDIYEKRIVKTIDYKAILEEVPDARNLCYETGGFRIERANGKYWADIDITNYDGDLTKQSYSVHEGESSPGRRCWWWEGQYWKHVYIDLETEEAYLVSIGEKIFVYDIQEKRTVKAIDYKTILEEYVPGYYYTGWGLYSSNGKYYLQLGVLNAEADEHWYHVLKEDYDEKYVWIDLEGEEVYCVSDDFKVPANLVVETSERGREWENEIGNGTIKNFLEEEKGLSYEYWALEAKEYNLNGNIQSMWSCEDGVYVISVLWSSVSNDNEMIEEYFPGLKDYDAKEDDKVTFLIAGYPGKEEIMEILQFLQ